MNFVHNKIENKDLQLQFRHDVDVAQSMYFICISLSSFKVHVIHELFRAESIQWTNQRSTEKVFSADYFG